MKPIYKRVLLFVLLPLGIGCLLLVPIVNSENGYVAGFVFLPILILVFVASVILFLAGLIVTGLKGASGLWIVLAGVLLLCGFVGAGLLAKHLELGAYKEDPMVPITPTISNIVLFKQGITEEQISDFWDHTLSTQRADNRGSASLPGIQVTSRLSEREGHEVVQFGFFAGATEEQKQYVYERVRASPIVFELRENVPTKDFTPSDIPNSNVSHDRPKKTVVDNGINSAN